MKPTSHIQSINLPDGRVITLETGLM
ncbi:MAG: hypothetical protein RLZZ617_485, partial [Bacteroidota bacterium]